VTGVSIFAESGRLGLFRREGALPLFSDFERAAAPLSDETGQWHTTGTTSWVNPHRLLQLLHLFVSHAFPKGDSAARPPGFRALTIAIRNQGISAGRPKFI
jgi:hypothetical protein